MSKRKLKMSKKQLTVVSIALGVALVGSTCFYTYKTNEFSAASIKQISDLKSRLSMHTKTVYVATKDIAAGVMITKKMFTEEKVMTELPESLLATKNPVGKMATVNIKKGTHCLKTMASEKLIGDLKERECGFIWLSTNLKENDYVDVRILMPNGEDFIVAAKKAIHSPDIKTNNVFLWLTEEELLSLDAAVVDANLHNGKIYTTKYVRASIQEESLVTYEPNASVIQLMRKDPNIINASARTLSIDARTAMEQRLATFKEANPDFVLDDQIIKNKQSETNLSTDQEINGEVLDTVPEPNPTASADPSIAGSIIAPESPLENEETEILPDTGIDSTKEGLLYVE